jgi:glucose/mannose-6-phosphate isomerase
VAGYKLDDPRTFKRYDPEGMRNHLHRLPQLCQQAWQMALSFKLPPDYADIDKVLVLGMGGSAIGGDLAASLAQAEARLPVIVCRGYELPAFTDARTLVIASSYSGNTEETLASFERALKTEAKKLAITTGGRLKAMAQERGIPVFSFDYQAQPRAALPFSLLPILCLLSRLGLVSDKSPEVAETVPLLEGLSARIAETVPQAQNPAKQLASRLYNHLPVVYGAGITAEVAHRWKTQLNENSKAWAFHELPQELAGSIVVVLLRSALLAERIQLRYRITTELLERAGVGYQTIDGEGGSPLSQMMSLVLFGDYTSYYLAMLYETDPSPVKAIDFLKQKLEQG